MNKSLIILRITILLAVLSSNYGMAQNEPVIINVNELTLEEIKTMTKEDLVQLPFDQLIQLVEKFKLSSLDELYALLNPSQSTASKMVEDVFDAPLSTTVITKQELEQSGARNIPEALRLAPGIIVREKTNGNYDVHIRGNDYIPPGTDLINTVNSTTLIMIDNRPVYNNFLGATFWENLPVSINDLEKIEIIYGPASALYGPNAVSGVIHLITKKVSKDGFSSTADIQMGNYNSQIAHGAIAYKKNDIDVKLSANFENADRFQETYYIPQMDQYATGEEVGEINATMDTTYDASLMSTDYANAVKKGAVNLMANYQPTEKLQVSYMGSYQNSSAQTAYMDLGSVISRRESSTFSNNMNLTAGNFDANLSSLSGHINAIQGLPGYEYDFMELNGKMGYNFKYKNLVIRPGIDANYNQYSDEKYVDTDSNSGLLNGSSSMGTIQGSLRVDYTAFEKLRLVGAVMQGYFYKVKRNYTSFQFAASYKLGENTLLRAVASKANSGLFVLNTYMNKDLELPLPMGQDGTLTISKSGNTDLAPLEMQMYEFGVRQKIGKKVQADLSLFYNEAENYTQLVSDMSENQSGGGQQQTEMIIEEQMQNLDMKSEQLGTTLSVKYVANDKFNASIFGTYQHTKIKNYEVTSPSFYEAITGETLDPGEDDETLETLSFDHNYTPAFYGGANVFYKPFEKLYFNASFYGYSKQKTFYTFGQDYLEVKIDPKLIVNLKVSYQLTNWMDVYVNCRNLTNQTSNEFLFTDKVGGVFLGGLKLTF